jgi:UDP-2,3-diacylglucosamine pyrophosphatase LpxH
MKTPAQYKTIIISDLHLGSEGAKAKEVVAFLKSTSCDTLIMNGDIIDGWQLKRRFLEKEAYRIFRVVLKMIEEHGTKVIYLRGNHDDFLDQIIPFQLGKQFSIRKDYILKSGKKQFFITHGDIFDSVTSNMKWLAHLGDIGYTFLLVLISSITVIAHGEVCHTTPFLRKSNSKSKKPSIMYQILKKKLAELALPNDCEGIICGHIHKPEIKAIGEVTYMNSGDWVESLSALIETHEGIWELMYYANEALLLSEEDTNELILNENKN